MPLLTPAFFDDPHPELHRLRAAGRVQFVAELRGYLVLGYQEVADGLNDPRLSSERIPALLRLIPEGRRESLRTLMDFFAGWTLMSDGERHRHIRRALIAALDPPTVRELVARIPGHVDDLLIDLEASTRPDWMQHVAAPLPARVVADLLGWPELDTASNQAFADRVHAFFELRPSFLDDAALLQESVRWLSREVLARCAGPTAGLIGRLSQVAPDREPLTADEVVSTVGLILFGANGLPRHFVGNALHALLADGAQRARWNPGTRASEELLRFEGPTHLLGRIAAEPLALGGTTIPRGSTVFLSALAANRDPDAFSEPDRLDLARQERPPLSFGAGPHACLGAALARAQCDAAIGALFARHPHVRLVPSPLRWRRSLNLRGFDHLPLQLS